MNAAVNGGLKAVLVGGWVSKGPGARAARQGGIGLGLRGEVGGRAFPAREGRWGTWRAGTRHRWRLWRERSWCPHRRTWLPLGESPGRSLQTEEPGRCGVGGSKLGEPPSKDAEPHRCRPGRPGRCRQPLDPCKPRIPEPLLPSVSAARAQTPSVPTTRARVTQPAGLAGLLAPPQMRRLGLLCFMKPCLGH